MSNNRLPSPLEISDVVTYHDQELYKCSVTIDDKKVTFHFAMLKSTNLGSVLMHCVSFFNDAQSINDIQDDAEALKQLFTQTLRGQVLTKFRSLYSALEEGEFDTIDNFQELLMSLVAKYAEKSDRSALLDYIGALPRKKHNVSIPEHFEYTTFLNECASWLPGEREIHTDSQLKQALFNSMPTAWAEHFLKYYELESTTLEELQRKMQTQESLSNAKSVLHEARQSAEARGIHEAKRNKHDGKRNNNDTDKGRPNKRVKTDTSQPSDSGTCQHCKDKKNVKSHAWADCFHNVNNPNSPLVKKLLAKGQTTTKNGVNATKGSNNRNSSEQHVVEVPEPVVMDVDTTDRRDARCTEGCLHDDDFSDLFEIDAVEVEKLQQQQRLDACVAFRMAEHRRVFYGIMSRRGHH